MSDSAEREQTTRRLAITQPVQAVERPDHGDRASFVVLAGWEIGREIVVDGEELVIGRDPDADFMISLPSVSRKHIRIVRRKEGDTVRFEVTDLGSMNGTLLNYVNVKTTEVRNGDKIQLGDVVLKFVLQDPYEAQFHEEVHRRIHYNELTGLLTIEALKSYLDQILMEVAKTKKPFVLAMTDLDGLKRINDAHGHQMGSDVIRMMGVEIRNVLRADDRAGLYGGDETTIVYPRTTSQEALFIAEELRKGVEARSFMTNTGEEVGVTISQGLAEWPTHGKTASQLIAAADGALYAAKGSGRNCICISGE